MAKTPSIHERSAIVRDSIGMLGFWMTTRYVLIRLLTYKPALDNGFDRRYGTDTAGRVRRDNLGIVDRSTSDSAGPYLPSPERITRRIVQSLPIDFPSWTFVDFGSGKGRVCLVASTFAFRRVIGIEISQALHDVALRNIARFAGWQKSAGLEAVCVDARAWEVCDGDVVFHFYHPFGSDILRQVLRNIDASIRRRPRRVLIVYLASTRTVLDVFAEFPAFLLTRSVSVANPHYDWALFTNSAAPSTGGSDSPSG